MHVSENKAIVAELLAAPMEVMLIHLSTENQDYDDVGIHHWYSETDAFSPIASFIYPFRINKVEKDTL